ncbi:beta-ketoacyl-[acyl-carrier-protein] synthase family protein [Labrys wisconsinensis]|uniref:Nodulation protein E n=1 Tax=Labrys wisconsinensis TaxID=425677 RepID=A0ABU0IZ17_9HYPH|nr:beta-ketoacyl-[acyl-carrier-protein] synthase family protein [Labrys wisconsinensis]MDQ0467256.1 nodulation protein E [Labrys wisconsinensis]
MGRRVLVTGCGAVTAAGLGLPALWHAARDGVSAVRPLDLARPLKSNVRIAARLEHFDPAAHIDAAVLPFCDRFTQFALVAAAEALAQAGLPAGERLGPRTAVIVGTGIGGAETIEAGIHNAYVTGQRIDPWSVPRLMPNAAASQISARIGAQGPSFAVSSACASGAQAIGLGAHMVRAGLVERAVVGGAEACITASGMKSWEALRVLSPDLCRPFSRDRNGMTLGEGAGIFVLEDEETAARRGARPLAELLGYGTSSDAGDIVRPDPGGAAAAMAAALADAGLAAGAVDYVNAHGTGTIANDAAETAALREVFGERLAALPVSSTKPVHGHALGAAGAIELAVTLAALAAGIVPPTLNWTTPDPRCELDCVPGAARPHPIGIAMSNSFAFGGINASLVLGRVEGT